MLKRISAISSTSGPTSVGPFCFLPTPIGSYYFAVPNSANPNPGSARGHKLHRDNIWLGLQQRQQALAIMLIALLSFAHHSILLSSSISESLCTPSAAEPVSMHESSCKYVKPRAA